MGEYFAHSRKIMVDGIETKTFQSLEEHHSNTGAICASIAKKFNAEIEGDTIGKQHDNGKATDGFQNRVKYGGDKVDHSTAGAMHVLNQTHDIGLAACIMGHHGGLPNIGSTTDAIGYPTFMGRKKKWDAKQIIRPNSDFKPLDIPALTQTKRSLLSESFRIRMLYSCLVDADFLDTERFMQGKKPRGISDDIPTLCKRLQAKLDSWANPESELNQLRNEITQSCLNAHSFPRGLFTVTASTGSGKSIASLAFGLNHALYHGMDRVIYVIPYTSIIEQNAEEFRKILGEKNVLEHHSNIQFDDNDEDEKKLAMALATENWDCPVVVTTAVQFFESMYSNKPSQCRKLHNISNSVVIFDEAQMLPLAHLRPCVAAIGELAEHFKSSVVLCTATQPSLNDLLSEYAPSHKITEICPSEPKYFEKFRRVTFKREEHPLSDSSLAKKLCEHDQVLCIVNSRKAAQSIFSRLPEDGSFHLSTLMNSVHRRKILDEIRYRLRNGLPCRVVSTSLIEAGIDIDFPAVYREMAGLDAILQAAGRCNREGKNPAEQSIVTIFRRTEAPPIMFKQYIDAAEKALSDNNDPADPRTMKAYFDELRKLRGPEIDKNNVVSALSSKLGIEGCILPFQTVSERFHLIDNDAHTIYIPYGEGVKLIRRLQDGERTKPLFRALGRYSVQVYNEHFQSLYESGAISMVDDDSHSAILLRTDLYNERTGLSLEADSGQALFG